MTQCGQYNSTPDVWAPQRRKKKVSISVACSTWQLEEPLLRVSKRRFVLFPIQYYEALRFVGVSNEQCPWYVGPTTEKRKGKYVCQLFNFATHSHNPTREATQQHLTSQSRFAMYSHSLSCSITHLVLCQTLSHLPSVRIRFSHLDSLCTILTSSSGVNSSRCTCSRTHQHHHSL